MRLNIRTKIMGGYLTTIGWMAVLIAVVIASLNTLGRGSDALLNQQFPVVDYSKELMAHIRNEQQLFTDYALVGSPAALGEIEIVRREIADTLAALEPLLTGEQRALLDQIREGEETLATTGAAMGEIYLSAGQSAAQSAGKAQMEVFDRASSELVEQLATLEVAAKGQMQAGMATIDKAQTRALTLALSLGALALIISLTLGLALSLAISRSVAAAARAAGGLACGDL